ENENGNATIIQGSINQLGTEAYGNITSTTGGSIRAAITNTNSSLNVKGGDVANFNFDDPSNWINSLKNIDTWDIIEYEEVHSIFDLLEDNLRKEVLEALGKRILKVNIESIKYPMSDDKKPYAHQLGKQLEDITNIEECEIFSTVMKKKNRHMFSSYICYDSPDKPVILIQRIPGKMTKKKYINIKIGWIVVGYPTKTFDFDLSNQVIFKSEKYDFKTKKHIEQADQDIQNVDQYVLATCILDRVEETNTSLELLNPRDSKLIVGTHFSHSKDSACSFFINLNESESNGNPVLRLSIW
ncbi:12181_t:CDS:2, partial [Cetraspora pellucida]